MNQWMQSQPVCQHPLPSHHGNFSWQNALFLSKFLKSGITSRSGAFARVRHYIQPFELLQIHHANTWSIRMVEANGIEPMTSCLQSTRSPNWAKPPFFKTNFNDPINVNTESTSRGFLASLYKGGDPAAPSGTATLLRLHPSHEAHRGRRPPCG